MYDTMKIAIRIGQILLLVLVLIATVKHMLGIELIVDEQTQAYFGVFASCMVGYILAEMAISQPD